MRAAILLCGALCAGGCTPKELPPIQPAADMCALYRSYAYSPAAAAVEGIDSLRSHVANEATFTEKCISRTNSPGGPR